jgi:hypothetical protein
LGINFPIHLWKTWSNNRYGLGEVAKRLDQFLAHNALLQRVERYRAWVSKFRCSNNFRIVLEQGKDGEKPGAPFKYNPSEYEEEDFQSLVRDNWKHYEEGLGEFLVFSLLLR